LATAVDVRAVFFHDYQVIGDDYIKTVDASRWWKLKIPSLWIESIVKYLAVAASCIPY
jgi:hypothetical protein